MLVMKSSQTIALSFATLLSCLFSVGAQTFEERCLVYTSRSTDKSTGYWTGASSSSALLVVGPQFLDDVAASFPPSEEPQTVSVRKRSVVNYFIYPDPYDKKKRYYIPTEIEDRTVAAINLAKDGSTIKPSVSLAIFADGGYATPQLNDNAAIGKALWKSPYPGAPAGWLASSLSSTYKTYDVNPAYNYDNPGDTPFNYAGQAADEYLPCTVYSGSTTYTLNSTVSKLTEGKSLDDACATVEAWLQSQGITEPPPIVQ